MTKITQIDDRGAVVAWSPTDSHADVIAVGSNYEHSSSQNDPLAQMAACPYYLTSYIHHHPS